MKKIDENRLAWLINPKTRELVEVTRFRNSTVRLYYPGDYVEAYHIPEESLGAAYWAEDEEYDVGGDTYYRSHSPGSQVKVGKGYGVCLYSGLALRAYSDTPAAGIASPEEGNRSSLAHAFWHRAVENELAVEDYGNGGSSEQETEVSTEGYVPEDCDIVGDDNCTSVDYVETRDLTVRYTAEGGETEVQYLPAENVARKGLIYKMLNARNSPEYPELPPELLVGLNLSMCRDVELIEEIYDTVRAAGLGLEFLDPMFDKINPETAAKLSRSKQLRMMFPNGGRKRMRPNADVQRAVDEMWGSFYGGLTEL